MNSDRLTYNLKWMLSLFCMLGFLHLKAQLSPGDLSAPHAHLEGIANCTKCHVLGDKVTNDKCLACHKEIDSRIDQGKGYHASAEVAGKDCFACHSDHHGRNFEIVRFDEEKFNHNLTGFKLTGAHARQDCRECHRDENIASQEIREKKFTYLGLKTECASCHVDVHQNSLSGNCASCHTTEVFKPATLFDHSKTEFPLKGQHKNVDCSSCHQVVVQNGQLYQQFAGRKFNSCASCHTDAHSSRLGTNCNACHVEESFNQFIVKATFNHQATSGFPLLGQHKKLDCAACHDLQKLSRPDNVFGDFAGKNTNQCQTCHKDVHDGKFGNDCRQCHTEASFQKIANLDKFQHDLTGFPLEGKHQLVDCRKCHETNLTDPLPHNACSDCHADFHKGQFITANHKPDCKECHTVHGFEGSLFTIEQHNATAFPLEGAHLATPCIACHLKNEEWTFRNIGHQCVDCHTNVHEGFLSEKYFPEKDCRQCHSPDAWADITFDHTLTGFPLQGRHAMTNCTQCHLPDPQVVARRSIPFTGLPTNCAGCHENIHGDQFEINTVTDCARCHAFEGWLPSTFDHDNAAFKLEGAHRQVDCAQCHRPEVNSEGREFILYKLNKLECVDCHM